MIGIWILGGGGHAKVALATLAVDGKAIAGLYDDDPAKQGLRLLGHEIIGVTPPEDWWNSETRSAFIAIGSNKIRERVAARRANWAVARHPAAHVHATVALAAGTLVCAGVVIQPDTCLGAHAIANTACSIDHDCRIGDFAHIAPGAHLAGGVTVGARSFIGIGASIGPGVRIGDDVTVGAGAAVLRDIPHGETWVGVPARSTGNAG